MEWFKDGEINTKFFYIVVNGRKSRLKVKKIQNGEGQWLDDQEKIAEATLKVYNK